MSDTPTFAARPTFLGVEARADAAVVVAGVPFDIGTTNRSGARFGPQAIRHASRMLIDGAHPLHWMSPVDFPLADVGDFAIALGDIAASLKLIEAQASNYAHLVAP
ncbi:MAG: agmatinase, partial [Alphaproteobacteria bacterium]|nr:agmatinase [Alphaproteobacteria bacterium]